VAKALHSPRRERKLSNNEEEGGESEGKRGQKMPRSPPQRRLTEAKNPSLKQGKNTKPGRGENTERGAKTPKKKPRPVIENVVSFSSEQRETREVISERKQPKYETKSEIKKKKQRERSDGKSADQPSRHGELRKSGAVEMPRPLERKLGRSWEETC